MAQVVRGREVEFWGIGFIIGFVGAIMGIGGGFLLAPPTIWLHRHGVPRVFAGGIIPPKDAEALKKAGVAAVYTPKDYDISAIMRDIVEIVDRSHKEAA